MSQTVGDETKEQKQFQAANPDDSQTVDIASVLEFIPFSATYDEVAAEFSDLKMYASDNGTMFKIEFSADLTNASDDYAGEIISVLGEENIEMELTQSYTLRMDTSGNLISTEMELIAKFYEIAPETDNSENGGEENGEVAPVSDVSETPPAEGDEEESAPVNAKREGSLRISFKTTVKDASSVKLPTKAELDTYKKPETTEEPSEGGEETPAA
ncbi:MAG: hypothetical protein IJX98_07285 [Clostridia bacterium]|nr:hypothetical protein [Clostridia bacterium]